MSDPGSAAQELIAAVAAYRLAGSTLRLPDGPLPESEWAALFAAAHRQRLLGLLAAAVADGAMEVTASQFEELAVAHGVAMVRALDIESAAIETIDRLEAAGIGVRALKGLATAHLDMHDPSFRLFADVDLLPAPGRFGDALRVLGDAGMTRSLPERRPGFDERFLKEETLYGPNRVEIDLHRVLVLGAYGLSLDPHDLWDSGEAFELGGRRVLALSPERRLLHACYGSLLGDRSPRLMTLRDAAQLAARDDLDGDALVAMARRARSEVVVARALRLAGDTLGAGPGWPLWEWAGAYRERPWDRFLLRAYESHGGSNTTTLLSGVLGLRGVADRAAYLIGMTFPSRTYVSARRAMGRPSEWRHGLRELVRAHAGRRGATG